MKKHLHDNPLHSPGEGYTRIILEVCSFEGVMLSYSLQMTGMAGQFCQMESAQIIERLYYHNKEMGYRLSWYGELTTVIIKKFES